MNLKLERMWVNQPSKNQLSHKYHGLLVLADMDQSHWVYSNGWWVTDVYLISGDTESMRMQTAALSKGWPEHLRVLPPIGRCKNTLEDAIRGNA